MEIRANAIGKIKNIRADLSENMLKSGYFITILHKNSGKLSTPPPPRKHQPRSPMLLVVSKAPFLDKFTFSCVQLTSFP
jgi:hypothetical protein